MTLDWTPFVDLVRNHQRFLLLTHIRPDGDALGSQLALADALEQCGKTVRVIIGSRMPDRYLFMDPGSRIERYSAQSDCFRTAEAIIILDTGTWNQLGDCGAPLQQTQVPKMVIDHHRTQEDLSAVRLVDAAAEATGRLVWDAFQALGKTPSANAATMLFIALAMDTGWFHHSSTGPSTFALAERLTALGAEPVRIYEQLYERNTLGRMRLQGRMLDRLTLLFKGQVAISEIHLKDYPETGSRPPDTEDFVQLTRAITDVELGVLLIEQLDGRIKVSFRSREKVDASKLAEQFGGGGHVRAAGATVAGPMAIARQQVLAAVEKALG
ncbi:MAG TPA: bifunctional oligoribonuclease/PAP phosphatase NrnA [Gemmataceae bacterium]|jgi:phosphoesterase RecJ-like protein|nr:bifunctional oligoribonuclease/PAP phosphatase NrnA [Gemmataceae bacterium]